MLKSYNATCLKWTYGLSGYDYRVVSLSKSYLTTTGITIQSLKLIGQFQHDKINEKIYPSRTYGPTLIIEKLRF